MAVTVSDIKTDFPEFAGLANGIITRFLAKAALRVSAAEWGLKFDDGIEFLTAHLLQRRLEGTGSGSGPVTSEKVGDISVGYAASKIATDSEFGSTVYGRMYLQLCSEIFAVRRV